MEYRDFGSVIIKERRDLEFVYRNLFVGKGIPRLIFRSSRDGKLHTDFHRCCDGKANTITFIKSAPYKMEES